MLSVRTIEAGQGVTLRLEGELMGLEVGELGRVAEALLTERRTVRLDLSALAFADSDGAAALRSLRERGALLENASSFVLCLLEGG